jgi:hypothetical protein
MSKRNEDPNELQALSAKVTGLTMLVEALYVSDLNSSADPAAAADRLLKSITGAEQKVRSKMGEQDYILLVSEMMTSLIDRALARVLRLREPPA